MARKSETLPTDVVVTGITYGRYFWTSDFFGRLNTFLFLKEFSNKNPRVEKDDFLFFLVSEVALFFVMAIVFL